MIKITYKEESNLTLTDFQIFYFREDHHRQMSMKHLSMRHLSIQIEC